MFALCVNENEWEYIAAQFHMSTLNFSQSNK